MQEWTDVIAMMQTRSGAQEGSHLSYKTIVSSYEDFGLPAPDLSDLASQLPRIDFEEGLTDTEVAAVEIRFGFRFPPDLMAFLQTALPHGEDFPNWRSGDEAQLREWLDLPLQGILFDIEYNDFWLPEWGPAPATLPEALQACRLMVAQAPQLIPIYAHRFMPSEPQEAGNPVFSVYQTDIVYYGSDLRDYLWSEFGTHASGYVPGPVRPIRFWNIDRFQEVCWSKEGGVFWNR